jgi:hypothetical protein
VNPVQAAVAEQVTLLVFRAVLVKEAGSIAHQPGASCRADSGADPVPGVKTAALLAGAWTPLIPPVAERTGSQE